MATGGFGDAELNEAYAQMRQTFERLEESLAGSPYLAGDTFSLGDIAMVPFVERMTDLKPELTGPDVYPKTHAWLARLAARPSWQDTFFFGGADARVGAVAAKLTV